jgi:glycerophosphoryl diester phosphodiesterase
MLSPELIAELKRRDLGVWTWTVNEPPVMRALIQWGIDSITSDRPDLVRKELEKLK